MASISTSDGKRRIQFVDVDGKRKTLRLPDGTSKKLAESIKKLVERLLSNKILGGLSIERMPFGLRPTARRYGPSLSRLD